MPEWRESDPPTPHQIAAIYRALRRAQEERKDEPGAADFYYGEMEMRRKTRYRRGEVSSADTEQCDKRVPLVAKAEQDSTRRAPRGEKVVLWLYWLVAGYGLRPSRALVALAITILFGALLLGRFGFDPGKPPDDGTLLFAAESSISLLRTPDTKDLTTWGHVVQIALRLAGPLFFGLALISLRTRVKR